MIHYRVYLEIADDGRCMAHVLNPSTGDSTASPHSSGQALPGCIVRAPTRDEALSRVPEATRETHAWLRRHGEPAPPEDESIGIEIAGESTGLGPFDPGDAAALFPPDREPVTPEEMEWAFRMMTHARADLLALVRGLPDDVLDWQPGPRSFSIRRLLRHVGNAEEWYVSRIVEPETLPSEWEHDEELPIFEFLEMERRTALARLRQLTEEERSGVFHPTRWTNHPEESWTARKVLRRFLEHEREHTAQAREILAVYRCHLLARLAAERAGLLWQLIGLDEKRLTELPVFEEGDWTAKDLLAHVAAWDRWEKREMKRMLAGEVPDLAAAQDVDTFNAAVVAEWHDRTLTEVLAELRAARADWVAWLRTLPEEEFARLRSFESEDWSFPGCLEVQWRHDAEHAAQIAAWREAAGSEEKTGPKPILLAGLAAAREELLAVAALIPPEERASRPVCGEWTLKDVLGHITDWEWLGEEGLRQMATGRPPQVEHIEDIDVWNQVHVDARRDQSWEEVWVELHAARETLLEVLNGMSQADLARSFPFPWSQEGPAYRWVCVYLAHDHEHAEDLRDAVRKVE
ncbi:MAG: DinB family protein [Anaerolineae bacterium]